MKVQKIQSIAFGAIFSILMLGEISWAMEKEGASVSQNEKEVPASVIEQISNIKQFAEKMKSEGKNVYLVLGASNDEIDSLKDKSEADKWVFWNLLSEETHALPENMANYQNPYVDASFNDKNILKYAAENLAGVFRKIIVPQQVIEYTRWKMSEFSALHQMLALGGSMIFALDWEGENFQKKRHILELEELPSDPSSLTQEFLLGLVNQYNGYNLSYEDWEEFISRNSQLYSPLGYATSIDIECPPEYKEKLVEYVKNLSVASLTEEDMKQIDSNIVTYFKYINDPQYALTESEQEKLQNMVNSETKKLQDNIKRSKNTIKEMEGEQPLSKEDLYRINSSIKWQSTRLENLYDKVKAHMIYNKLYNEGYGFLQEMANENAPILNENTAKTYFVNKAISDKIQSYISSNFNPNKYLNEAREAWLKREFGKLFSKVEAVDIPENDPRNDIPSITFKLGRRNLILWE